MPGQIMRTYSPGADTQADRADGPGKSGQVLRCDGLGFRSLQDGGAIFNIPDDKHKDRPLTEVQPLMANQKISIRRVRETPL